MKRTRPMVAGPINRFLRRLVTLRLLVQVAILVLSILLAFAIDAWWDAHQERSRERDLLLELRDDFRANRPGLETTVINTAYNEFQFWDGRAATLRTGAGSHPESE